MRGRGAGELRLGARPGSASPTESLTRAASGPAGLTRGGACRLCWTSAPFGQSPLCQNCLHRAGLLLSATGEPVDLGALPRSLYPGRYRYRAVKCGNPRCKTCPHSWYVYKVWRVAGALRETYLGPAKAKGSEYEQPRLRAPQSGF